MYREFAPSSNLAPYIECYWESDGNLGARRILPDGCVDILLVCADREPESLNVVGLMTKAQVLDFTPQNSFFGIRFHPGMASAFVRGANELADQTEPLEAIWKRDADRILDQWMTGSGTAERIRIAEHTLLSRGPRFQPSAKLFSERQQRRLCVDRVGVPPKYLSRILRFRRVAEHLRSSRIMKSADLALEHGYYDQAHMIREFEEFSGLTPGRFLQSFYPPVAVASAYA